MRSLWWVLVAKAGRENIARTRSRAAMLRALRLRCSPQAHATPSTCEVSCLSRNLQEHMNFLILGKGKTGTLVAEVASERKHHFRVAGSAENPACSALTPAKLHNVDTIID